MSKIGIYPGSFDPITFGHLDIIQRSLNVVDTLIVAVSDNKSKNHFINIDADEMISQTIVDNFEIFEKLKKNEKISLQWLALWKSNYRYKNDRSVWSNNFKDFIFLVFFKILNLSNTGFNVFSRVIEYFILIFSAEILLFVISIQRYQHCFI